MSKKAQKPPRVGSALTDAVVAALAKVDDTTEVDPQPVAAESGCGATEVPVGSASPATVEDGGAAPGRNGFRSGPGSFSDLLRRWAGGAPLALAGVAPVVEPPAVETVAEPAKAEPAKVEPAKVEPAKVEPAKVEPEPEPQEEKEKEKEEPAKAAADETPEAEPPPGEGVEDDEVEAPAGTASLDGAVDVDYFGRTDVGLVREHNEDNFLVAEVTAGERNPEKPQRGSVDERGFVFSVCDGMGGAAAGEVASQMAVDTIFEVMSATPPATDRDAFARRLVTAIEEAGHRIFSAAKMDRTRRGMGTTATLAGLIDSMLFVGQVGDSRAYILRGDHLVQITKDQSLVNQLIEAGQLTEEEAEAFEHSNIILQALGTTEEVTVDLTFIELRQGDRLMMCSDGLSGLVHPDMVKEVMQGTEGLPETTAKLIQMANAGGGHDNITVILADFQGEGLSPPGDTRVSYQQYPLPPAADTPGARSLPLRETTMKPGATKPGADVKRADYGVAGPSSEIDFGGDSKLGVFVVAAIVILALLAGGWFLMNMGRDETRAADVPPPPVEPAVPVDDPLPDELPSEDPFEDPVEAPVETATGSVEITTDIDEGHLFVGDEDRGPISDGMTIDLTPGAYIIEARSGSAVIASGSVTVNEDATVTIELNMPVAPPEEPVAPDTAPPPSEDSRGGRGRGEDRRPDGEGGRRRRPGGGNSTGGGGSPPSNPF